MLNFSPILRTRRGEQIHPLAWCSEHQSLVPWTAVLITLVFAIPCSAQYAESVLVDEPFAYWLLDEVEGTTDLKNIGTESETATYSGPFTLGVPGLADPNRNAVRFAGDDEDGTEGFLKGYLNGVLFEEKTGVGRLFNHGADIGIGRCSRVVAIEDGEPRRSFN